jgi:hypothetical protein
MLIAPTVEDASLAPYWTFVPRMIDDRSVVLREHLTAEGEPAFTQLSPAELVHYARHAAASRAA